MKKWRIAEHHPEDRFDPDDDVADGIRSKISDVESKIKDASGESLNKLFIELRTLSMELAVRLYGE